MGTKSQALLLFICSTSLCAQVAAQQGDAVLLAQQAGATPAEQREFDAAQALLAQFASFKIDVGQQQTMSAFVSAVQAQVEAGLREASAVARAFHAANSPQLRVASFVQQGRAYDTLANAITQMTVLLPHMQGSPTPPPSVQQQLTSRIREINEQKASPIRCLAIRRYVLGVHQADVLHVDSPYVQFARTRLAALSQEDVARCVEEGRVIDSSFPAWPTSNSGE